MQKSIKVTIGIIILIFIYTILASFNLSINISKTYLYIINPIFFISTAIFLRITLGKSLEKRKLKKEIFNYTLVAVLFYIIIYMVSGLVVTFGKNPYVTNLKGVLVNFWIFGTIIIAKEYIRFKLINNVYEKDKIKIAVLISIVYIFFEMEFQRFLYTQYSISYIISEIGRSLIPLIARNLLASYISIYAGYTSAVMYEFSTKMYIWIAPILPNFPWIMTALIETIIPIILFMYIRYIKSKNDIYKSRKELESLDPRSVIPFIALVILAVWFATGVFPIRPVAIASGSMEKELCVGDIAIIKKCNSNDVEVGDIIEYQMEGFTVIHRVIEKKQRNGMFYFTTKGDNNKEKDALEVSRRSINRKMCFKNKILGIPSNMVT